jgi:NADPH:quinone reductase-like Zn-dependent oxidoreductase
MSSKGVPASECLQKNCPVPSNVLIKRLRPTKVHCLNGKFDKGTY